jgi:transketolase
MADPSIVAGLTEMASTMRLKALEMAVNAGPNGAHLGPAFSSIEILACLYGGIMRTAPQGVDPQLRDVFIPSKGHCVLSYYTALAYSGHFPVEKLDVFEVDGSELPGHPVMNPDMGIEFSGGSLGMGASQGVGLALAFKRRGREGTIFVLLGDGECDEGAVWEAAMSAAHFRLDNLVLIVDQNGLQYDGATDDIMGLKGLAGKFSSFGFDTFGVDGHSIEALHDTFVKATGLRSGKPVAIIADTVKGKGVSFMEHSKEWHHSRLTQERYEQAVAELTAKV